MAPMTGMNVIKILRINRVKTKTRRMITITANKDTKVNDGLAKSTNTLTETGSSPPGIKTEIVVTVEVEASALLTPIMNIIASMIIPRCRSQHLVPKSSLLCLTRKVQKSILLTWDW